MGNFVAGMIAGFLAFSTEGSMLREKVIGNIQNRLKGEQEETKYGNERMDTVESLPDGIKSSAGRNNVS
jgi:hypothetical protein